MAVLDSAKEKKVPIRIGINGGSLEKELLERNGRREEALVSAAASLTACFGAIILLAVSLHDVPLLPSPPTVSWRPRWTIPSTSASPRPGARLLKGSIKSALGIGILLSEGIGDTMRVSLTGDPVDEVRVAKEIQKSSFGQGKGSTSSPAAAAPGGSRPRWWRRWRRHWKPFIPPGP